MKYSAIAILLIAWFTRLATADPVTLQLKEGYLTVQVTLNGSFKGQFVLDTGADVSAVSPSLAQDIGLEHKAYVNAGTAGGKTINVPLTAIQSLSIGEHSVSLEPVVILDVAARTQGRLGNVDGIVGSDFLRNFIITIDFAEKQLYFGDQDMLAKRLANGVKVLAKIEGGTAIFLPVTLNNQLTTRYKLDTGAAVTHLTLADAKQLGFDQGSDGVILEQADGIAGSYDTLLFDLHEFNVGTTAPVQNLSVKAYDTPYGFIGSDYLQHFVLTLNYRDQYIILSSH